MNKKRIISITLSLVLLLTVNINTTLYANEGSIQKDSVPYKKLLVDAKAKINKELLEEIETEKEKDVRVVVELNNEPIIEKATQQGKKIYELNASKVESLKSELTNKQEQIIDAIEKYEIDITVHQQYTNIFNGFSATVSSKDVEQIANNPDVKEVYISNEYARPEPQMSNSPEITKSKYVNETYGYTGEGMVVAIIDTGIDPLHKDMTIDKDKKIALTKEVVSETVNKNQLKGKFYTEKVPYGYNYMDENSEILDLGAGASMHGMHVGGTVAANTQDSDGIDGVAPNAQLLALKVFGNDPEFTSTFGDVVIAAIDDAINLKADVMNLWHVQKNNKSI